METLTYADLIKQDPLWYQTRIRILERDNFHCSLCGDDKTSLQVSIKKIVPGQSISQYPDESLITLCSCCDAFAKANYKIHGFNIEVIKAVYMRIPKSQYTVRLYRLGETTLMYLFNQDHKIVTSYDLSSAVKGLREFLM